MLVSEKVVFVPEARLADLAKKVAKIDARAARNGQPALTLNIGPLYDKEFVFEKVEQGHAIGGLAAERHGIEQADYSVEATGYRVTPIGGVILQFTHRFVTRGADVDCSELNFASESHVLVARIDHTENGNVVSRAPGHTEDELDPAWQTAASGCQHCGKMRPRHETFLVREVASGAIVQVGSTCMAEYTGFTSGEAAISLFDLLTFLYNCTKAEYNPERPARQVKALDVLSVACALVREFGYEKAGSEYEKTDVTTKNRTLALFHGGSGVREYIDGQWKPLRTTTWDDAMQEDNRAKAAEVLAYVRNLCGKSDYEANLKVVLGGEWVNEEKHLGFAVSAVAAYDRHQERARLQDLKANLPQTSEWIGSKGTRIGATVTVASVREISGAYGVTYLIKMVDQAGHALTWFGSGALALTLKEGQTYDLKMTIKNHNEYKGAKETQVTRVSADILTRIVLS
jgi:hypothetical protein